MNGLVEFLVGAIAEDEDTARTAVPGPWEIDGDPRESRVYSRPTGVTVAAGWQRDTQHIAGWDPARVLAECDAKRRLVEKLHEEIVDLEDAIAFEYSRDESREASRLLLKLLAMPYAHRDGYREEWAV